MPDLRQGCATGKNAEDKAPADALVLFGAMGDLAHNKIFPALYHVVQHGHLDAPFYLPFDLPSGPLRYPWVPRFNRVNKWYVVRATIPSSSSRGLAEGVHGRSLAAGDGLPWHTERAHGSARSATFIIHSGHGFFVQVPLSGQKRFWAVTLLASPRDGQQ